MIKKSIKVFSYVLALTAVPMAFVYCGKKGEEVRLDNEEIDYTSFDESPVSGYTKIVVDESVFPIANEVNEVFMYEYDRIKIDLVTKSESEAINLLMNDSLRVAVLSRELNEKELEHLKGRVKPKMTHFATDAIVFVSSKVATDSIIDYTMVIENLKAKSESTEDSKIVVFDNINSSIVSSFKEKADVNEFPQDYAFYAGSTEGVVDYVLKNPNAIGVIGLNWLTQPSLELENKLKNIKVLAVKNPEDGEYYKASQNNIAEGKYPLTRKLYVVDIQGKTGLGVGYASYIAGYKGQRIVLKSKLLPFKVPPRELNVRGQL